MSPMSWMSSAWSLSGSDPFTGSWSPYAIGVALASLVLGAVVGSFCNVVIYRLPKMLLNELGTDLGVSTEPIESSDTTDAVDTIDSASPSITGFKTFNLSYPASHCPKCSHPLPAWQLFPLLSYFWLQGQCAFCHERIDGRYWKTEAFVSLWWLFCAFKFHLLSADLGFEGSHELWLTQAFAALLWACLGSALVCLAQIDWAHQLLPDALTQPLLWLGLLSAAMGFLGLSAQQSIMGAITGYMSLWLIAKGYRVLCHREGMGQGDMKLLAVFGAWLGPLSLIPLVLLASTMGAIVGTWRLQVRKDLAPHEPIAFGPFLVFAAFVLLIVGPPTALQILGLRP